MFLRPLDRNSAIPATPVSVAVNHTVDGRIRLDIKRGGDPANGVALLMTKQEAEALIIDLTAAVGKQLT